MKLPSLFALAAIVISPSAFAITDADIAPAALFGKTLTFTIVNGGAPYATNGTWSGAISSDGTGFVVANVTGDTVGISTTCTSNSSSGYTTFNLAKFIQGQKPASVTLYVQAGVGHYEVSIQELFGVSLNGTFTIGAPVVVKEPEIGVQQPAGTKLKDGVSKKSFGTVKVGSALSKVFTINNSGTAKLTGLGVTLSGKDKGDFTVSAPEKATLGTDEKTNSTTFKVAFKPKSKGTKSATITVKSNDADEAKFDIKLGGEGATK